VRVVHLPPHTARYTKLTSARTETGGTLSNNACELTPRCRGPSAARDSTLGCPPVLGAPAGLVHQCRARLCPASQRRYHIRRTADILDKEGLVPSA